MEFVSSALALVAHTVTGRVTHRNHLQCQEQVEMQRVMKAEVGFIQVFLGASGRVLRSDMSTEREEAWDIRFFYLFEKSQVGNVVMA